MRMLHTMPLMLVVAAGIAPPVRAETLDVQVTNFAFTPKTVVVEAGDLIRWNWVAGSHDVVAYAGASFDSGLRTKGTFEVTFEGGTVLYRCTPHSTLGLGDPPACSGMCGTITDTPPAIAPPAITQPSDGSWTQAALTIGGTGTPDAIVEVREEATVVGRTTAAGGGSWSIQASFGPGPHTVHAVMVADLGESEPSAPVAFTVDDAPPNVVVTTPSHPGVARAPLEIEGTASDDVAVGSVTILVRGLLLPGTYTMPASCAGCGTPAASWHASVRLGPGMYEVVARARDHVGNQTASEPVMVLVL